MAFIQRQVQTIAALVGDHAPSAVVSIVIAELFYKFHSFTLECIAFLVTWYVVDAAIAGPYQALRRKAAVRGH